MVLVTGGTGLIGSHLLMELIRQGLNVRATYRDDDSIKKTENVFSYYGVPAETVRNKIQWVKTDITDVHLLSKAIDGIDQVYHCAAMISFDPNDYKELVKINVEGTKNVVNACSAKKVKKLCYVSSIATLGPSKKGDFVDEENEWTDRNASVYARTKRSAELQVWRGMQEGLDAVIVNPGVVLGPGFWKSGSGLFFHHAAKKKKKTVPGGTGFISVHDVIVTMIQLMDSKIKNEQFILVDENVTFLQMMQRIAKELNVRPPNRTYSTFEIEIFWRLDWIRANLFGKKRILSKNTAKSLYQHDRYSSEKVRNALGIGYDRLDETIRLCCRLFREDFPE